MLTDFGSCFWLHWDTCLSSFYWVLQVVDAIISHGCFLRECSIDHSIVGERSRLDYGVELKVNFCDFWILSSNTKELNWLDTLSRLSLMTYLSGYFLLQDTVMMGADHYQTESEIASLLAEGKVPIGVGRNTKIR